PLQASLRTARPEACDLDATQAYGFLAQATPMLEQAGFGVFVPPWWTKRSARLGTTLTVRPKQEGGSGAPSQLGVDGICAYEWQVAVGDETITVEELERLAALKAPLVAVRGQWVELRSEEVASALRFFRNGSRTGEMRLVDAMAIGLGAAPASTGLPVVGVVGEGALADLMNPETAGPGRRYQEAAVPAGLVATLRPYQQRGLSWLAFHDSLGLGACLADDMGLGKTIQLLSLLLAEREQQGAARPDNTGGPRRGGRASRSGRRRGTKPTLLVCPMSLVSNWEREAARFAPALAVHVHHGTERLTGARFAATAGKADLVVTTYALATRDRDLLAGVPWRRVVLDEAQNIKNRNARQTRAIVSIPAERRVALTGTPVENRLSDLWSIMDFLNPGLLGDPKGFRTRFALPVERYGDEEAAGRLRRLTGPFILRRLKTDRSIIADLPDKVEMKVFCNLTREQATLYQAVVDDMLERIEASEGIERKGLVLATMVKLKQVCNHPAQLLGDRSPLPGRSGKLARLEEILEEVLAEGEKALVFTQFAEMGAMLKPHLQERLGREVAFLHGGTTKKSRDELVAGFQDDGGPGVFLLSLKAGGTGLNLTAANHVVHFDRWWNPAVENQATDRAFRIGQRRNVQVRKFVCAGTLEERIDQMIERKKELAERIVGAGEGWLTELSTDQLRQLVTLSADAVSEG
ncbi:MAG TPA: DEAD/DEAH box helicase, partial [Actinomycetota bacterium]|nr:DEAD/DEAH box helicase [Actinomycetota bacterium]